LETKWLFFDIGSTLVDETKAYDHRALDMLENTDITFWEFDQKRIELSKQGFDGNSEAIRYFGLTKTPWHTEDEELFDDVFEVLDVLKAKNYKLGIIANQVPGAKERLQAWGLLNYFDVIATSAELGVAKPDRMIFESALKSAGCHPQNAIMIGDRLDNDIIPAKAIGMNTVWVRRGLAIYQSVDLGERVADWIIDDLSDLKEIF
jgi:putative hydrolase of the HAD superfamily